MKKLTLTFVLAAAALLPAGAIAQAPDAFSAELLDSHNEERAKMDAPALAWSPQLQAEAQEYAAELARTGRMVHASNERRKGAGENLWMGAVGYFSAQDMMNTFLAEKKYYKPGIFPDVSNSGDWKDVGHYTQIIWHGTQEVGCAVAEGQVHDFLVCRYLPAGNILGRKMP